MRIAFVTPHYWPSLGGVERVAMNLGDAYRDGGHEVAVVTKRIDGNLSGAINELLREAPRFDPFAARGIEVSQLRLSLPRRAVLLPLAVELLPRLGRVFPDRLRRHGAKLYAAVARPPLEALIASADVVHALGGDLLALVAVEAAHGLGRPAIVTPFAHPGPRGFDVRAMRAWSAADAVIATSAADAAAYHDAGVPPDRVHVCGVPVPAFAAGEGEVRLPVPEDAPVVVFMGVRRPAKGWKLLLESAPQVWSRSPRARFAFVGPGEALPDGDERVLDVGRVSDSERAAWLRRATLLCLPSEFESFGVVLAEAWSEGVPVVVSDTPVLRELVVSSGGGVVTARHPDAIASAVASLLEQPDRARETGRAGRRYWKRECDPAVVAQRHLAVYRQVRVTSTARAARPPLGA